MNLRLSKSKIQYFLQCPKRLYLDVHQPDMAEDTGNEMQIQAGERVGEIARTLFPGGVLIPYGETMLAETENHLNQGLELPLYEATFNHADVLVRADILLPVTKGFDLYEVKSASSVKPEYFSDCAIQTWVMNESGHRINNVYLSHINTGFVYTKEGDYKGLLNHAELTRPVMDNLIKAGQWVEDAYAVLKGDLPDVKTGSQCNSPYQCPFYNTCHGKQPKYPVTTLPYGGNMVKGLLADGIYDIRDIPEDRLTSEKHLMVYKSVRSGKVWIDPELRLILSKLTYPRYYIDFETINPAVPVWLDTRPYQQLPFQWSCHIEKSPGNIEHTEFLDITGKSPMRDFTSSLIDTLDDEGPVIVYSSFEKSRLTEMAKRFPEFADAIESIISRIVDLLPLMKKHYYHPEMHGSWSIKYVLPTIVPELSYADLEEVQHGGAAQAAFIESISPETSDDRKSSLKRNMLKYCELDTLAMVEIVNKLAD